MNIEKKLSRNIPKLYAYWFFHNLIFAYVIERLFWAERGITVQQVVYAEIIYAVVVIVLEVPTGSLSDFWSRKNMMVLSSVCAFLEFLILIFAHNFWHIAFAVFVAAIGKALYSGTSNALLYDSLKLIGKEHDFEKILGRINFFDYTAGVIAALLGSFVAANRGYVSVYWLSLISTATAFLITLTLTEPDIRTPAEENKYWDYVKNAFGFLKDQSAIQFVIFSGIVISSCLTYADEFWQLYIKEIDFPVVYFGLFSAAGLFIRSITSIFAYKLKEKLSYKAIFTIMIMLFSLGLVAAGFTRSFAGILLLLVVFITSGIIEPLVTGYLHHRTDSSCRATVESFQSLAVRLAIIFVGLIFGYFSTNYSIFSGFRILGAIAFVYFIYYVFAQFKYIKE